MATVDPPKPSPTSLLSGMNLLWTSLFLVNALLYFVLFTRPIPATPRGNPLPDCLSAYSALPSAVAARQRDVSDPRYISALRESYRDKWVHLVGDSTLRESFYELNTLLRREGVLNPIDDAEARKREATKHARLERRVGSSKLTWTWRPFLSNATTEWAALMQQEFKPDLVVFSVGLHDLLYHAQADIDAALNDFVSALARHHPATPAGDGAVAVRAPAVLFRSSPHIVDEALKGHRAEAKQFRSENVRALNEAFKAAMVPALSPTAFAFADGYQLTAGKYDQLHEDGLHSQQRAALSAISLAALSSCHFGTPPLDLTAGQLTLFVLFLALVFTMMYAWLSSTFLRSTAAPHYTPLSQVDGVEEGVAKDAVPSAEQLSAEKKDHGVAVDKVHSAGVAAPPLFRMDALFGKDSSALMVALLQLCLILFFLFLMDGDQRLSWQLIGDKLYIRDTFLFICIVLGLFGYVTVTPTQEKGAGTILNRDQTEEWKGWMQILFVLYHYFAAKEMYNLIRVFIAAYVFLTGYGNLFFFQRYADFSFSRLMKLFFRLNFFVFFVCVAMNREYMQYYVCALHTTFFLFVYAFMAVASDRNKDGRVLALKFAVGFLLLVLVWDVPQTGLFDLLFGQLPIAYWKGSLHEWRFRSTLDHFVTIIGMLVACNVHHLAALYAYMEKQAKSTQRVLHAATVAACAVVLYLWYAYCLLLPKAAYNAYNPYSTWVPIIAYIVLRNLTPWLRTHNMFVFTWCGRITLETYILQFHVWLSDDAATLVFYTGSTTYPLVNFVIASMIYVGLAWVVFHLTTVISDALIPKNSTTWGLAARLIMIAAVWGTVYHASKLLLIARSG